MTVSSPPMAHSDERHGGNVPAGFSPFSDPDHSWLGANEDVDCARMDAALDILEKYRADNPDAIHAIDLELENGRAVTLEGGKPLHEYANHFACRDGHFNPARERIQRDSPIVAELKTNVIVKDEFTLVTDMSYHLSKRFSRPESSIMISLDHSACLLHAGSFEPAYILTISAIPSQVQPTTNKRNAALIQSFMADALSVSPERGIIRFVAVPEENLASNGATIAGEIERMEKQETDESRNFSLKRNSKPDQGTKTASTGGKRLSHPALDDPRFPQSKPSTTSRRSSAHTMPPPLPQPVYELSAEEKRMSVIAQQEVTPEDPPIPVRNSMRDSKNSNAPKVPPIPQEWQERPQITLGRRKSFLSAFRKSK